MKTIIAPTDFSPVSLNAVTYAAELASSINADLSLLYVYQLPMIIGEVPVPSLDIQNSLESADVQINQLKNDLAEKTGNRIGISTEIRTGIVINEIIDYCEELDPLLVVMASHGAGAVQRFFLGSNTLSAMKDFSWPLIIVPGEAKFKTICKIGLACDYQKVKDRIPINEIRNLIRIFKADLFVVHVSRVPAKELGEGIMGQAGTLQEMLADLHPRYEFISAPDVEKNLEDYAEKNDLDLLIVIPGKHGLMDRVFGHSHSKQMALHTRIPMMAVHE